MHITMFPSPLKPARGAWLLMAVAAASFAGRASAQGDDPILADWTFNNVPVATNNSPAPAIGAGTAAGLGMTNGYTYPYTPPTVGATNNDDIIVTAGSSTNSGTDQAWRIRGLTNAAGPPGSANGWNTAAPQYTQGAQFSVSTLHTSNIVVKYDWFTTNQGVADQQFQYTVDGTNWINQKTSISLAAGPNVGLNVASPNAFNNNITIDFGALGIHTVDNDPAFAIRMVSAYDQTFNNTTPNAGTGLTGFGTTYTGASGGVYNDTSGNWRFDNVIVSGTTIPTPEPASIVMAGLGLVSLFYCGWRRRRSA